MKTQPQSLLGRVKSVARFLVFGVFITCLSLHALAQAQTVVWSEHFDDGSGDANWAADSGVWQIGSPSVGPNTNAAGYRAFSGSTCATTGLNGNYMAIQDSRLVRIAPFVVPATNDFPRLRFWQWFTFAGAAYVGAGNWDEGSYGYVEIKAGTNGWQTVTPQKYSGSGSGIWTQPSIDLSPFAGQSVQVAFHFHSAHNTAFGWYIDDVEVVKGKPVFNNPEGFELGLGDWSAERGTWEVGTPSSGPGSAHGGTNCAGTVLAGNYASYVDSRLVSPPFEVPGANTYPRLRFWQWYSFAGAAYVGAGNWDDGSYGYLEIKAGTNGWQSVTPQTFSGSGSGIWTQPSIDLSPFAGQSVQVAFHFHSALNTAAGWYMDDVEVVTGKPKLNNPEGFELGLGDWSAERGTWEVGTPSSGPGSAHGGTNCAGTVLAGNYASYVDSRLVSPPFDVPGLNSFPRLRFWQWFTFAGAAYVGAGNWDEGSYGYVEIKAGTNGWKTVTPQKYGGSGSGIWTRPSIDLSPFAGKSVQVAFHFHSALNTAAGWYIDDVEVVKGKPVVNNPEAFELGLGDWSAERGTWEVGTPTSGPGSAHGGTNCAGTVLAGNYASYVDSRLVSPPVLIPPADSSPSLRFWHWYSFGSAAYVGAGNWDEGSYGYVEIRAGTNDWQTLSSQNYSGASGGWLHSFPIDLTPFSGQTVQIAFHFHSALNVSSGWYVDDVWIQSLGWPTILVTPASQTASVGSSASLDVAASGDSPLSYQWRCNSNSISGATNTSLALSNLQLTNTGYYDVVVTNLVGAVTSTPPALLSVVINFDGVDIGNPGAPGSFTQSGNGVYTVTGSGEDIVGTADAFYYVQQSLSGDCQIVARVASLSFGSNTSAQAGIMIRESLADGSKHASLLVSSSTNGVFRRRLETTGPSVDTGYYSTNYTWLSLWRKGNTLVGLSSTNGTNWKYEWFTTIWMSNQVQVGFAVTAHQNASYAAAVFDNVYIGSLTPLPSGPSSGPMLFVGGEPWTTAEFQRVGGFKFLLGSVAGDYFTVGSTTNIPSPFATWTSLGTVTNTYGILPFVDVHALTNASLFYGLQRLGP